jgi:starch synthase (maltosyl-transferring)
MPDKPRQKKTRGKTPGGKPRRSGKRTRPSPRPPRVLIEGVQPEIDGGRFPVKRTLGDRVEVEVDLVADGHYLLDGVLLHRYAGESAWQEVRLQPLVNDRYRADFTVDRLGRYLYTLQAWVDHFSTWLAALNKKVEAGQDVDLELRSGAALVEEAAGRCRGKQRDELLCRAAQLAAAEGEQSARIRAAGDERLSELMAAYPDRSEATEYGRELGVVVDRERARFGAWYELFPRSCADEPGKHGTFRDCEARLPYLAALGFDILYLPPIHPIGLTHRKGKNNDPVCQPGDPGSPWAIGGKQGGHKAIHPQLGTLDDFRRLLAKAKKRGLEVALDIAFQCSPDHPYLKEHPEWFRTRPDGSVQYAENPPKKYQDIYPLDFSSDDWQSLWNEMKSLFDYWIEQGVRIFRVDNPHTKPLAFWEWLITEIKREHPEVILFAEAFTRPKMMYALAKLGFCQSYTYFTWRNARWELEEYFTELTTPPVREFFRPNLWPNTPDILHEELQLGGRPAFAARLVLAATLGASYGIYGPAFELCVNTPREKGSEEYLNSEKYEIKHWDLDQPGSLRELIARVNRIRRENPALQGNRGLTFHRTDNERLICYSKQTDDGGNAILVVVNLDPLHSQSGFVQLSLADIGVEEDETYLVEDLLAGPSYRWIGARNYVELDPARQPAHIFLVKGGKQAA